MEDVVVEGGHFEDKAEEMLKEIEDDVFKEAIGTKQRMSVEGAKAGTFDHVSNKDGGGVEAVSVNDETETFEEASEVPSELQNKADDLIDHVTEVDKIDEGGTEKEVINAALSGGKEGYEEETEKRVIDEDKEVAEVVGRDDSDEVGTELEVVNDELSLEEEHDVNGKEKVSYGEDSKSGMMDGNNEIGDSVSVNAADMLVYGKPENGDSENLGTSKARSEEIAEYGQNGRLDEKLVTGDRDDKNGELITTSDSRPLNLLDHKKHVRLDKIDAELKEDSSGLNSRNKVDNGESMTDTSVEIDTELQDESNGELRNTSAVMDAVVEKMEEVAEVVIPPTQKIEVAAEVVTPPALEKLMLESMEKLMLESREKFESGTIETSADDKASQSVPIDETYHKAQSGHSSAEEIEMKAAEPEIKSKMVPDEKQCSQVNKQQEIQRSSDAISSSRNSANPTLPTRPAGLGRAAPLLEPAPRAVQHPRGNGTVSHIQSQKVEDPNNGESDEYDETREKLQMIRVKFLRLAVRLGQTPHNVVVAQVLYRLGLAEQLRGGNGGRVGPVSYDRANAMAEQLEAAGQEPLDFSCTIMVLGKTGVGKSATVNSIFDEVMFSTDAFQTGTKKVQDVVGTVDGIRVRVIDTPGLLPSWSDQRHNEKILQSVKQFVKKTPPDIVLYLDRLDMQSRDFGDMPLLRTITETFGPSIWFNAIVVLTHAASHPPDGPNGTSPSYDMFVTQRSHVVQQAIRQAAGDMRLMNPVSLVENHSACRTNRAGQRVLPNGQIWKPHLLLLSFASKILAEANSLLKLQVGPTGTGRPFATRSRAPPLPFLLSSLLQSRPQVKLPEEQFGDGGGEDDTDGLTDSDDDLEYEELPPFKRLTKAQMEKLTKTQVQAYLDELEYREKLFMKKQLKEEKRRRRMMKKAMAEEMPSNDYTENVEESGSAASVPVPMPDLALPITFDSDNPTHRYRYLDNSNQWLVRPVLETHGWDHDVGYEGINVEKLFVVKEKIPVSFSSQITKDKKDANVQMEIGSSLKHGEGKLTSLGFDMLSIGKDLAYTLRSETRFSNFQKNKATAGLSFTLLGDAISAGMKVEDKLILNKRFEVVMNGGAMAGHGDVAYGGSLEALLRDKDHPIGRSLSTLGLSVMDWHGDLAVGCNIQSQIPVGRSTNLIARANVNNKGAGLISFRLNTSEQLQLALIAIIPILGKLFGSSQQMQYGQ